jgi:hypothetical protein
MNGIEHLLDKIVERYYLYLYFQLANMFLAEKHFTQKKKYDTKKTYT